MKERWRNVSTRDCLGTIIFSVIALLIVVVVPFSFSDSITLTYKTMPFVGDGTFITFGTEALEGVFSLIPNASEYASLAEPLFTYATYAFFLILGADVIFALLLIITRFKFLRIIFRIISIILSLATLILGFVFLAYVVGSFIPLIMGGNVQDIANDIILIVKTQGITTALVISILSFILVRKQLKWFRKPAWANKKKYTL
jgi:hypothetical protein